MNISSISMFNFRPMNFKNNQINDVHNTEEQEEIDEDCPSDPSAYQDMCTHYDCIVNGRGDDTEFCTGVNDRYGKPVFLQH